jgi:hypothetical protein
VREETLPNKKCSHKKSASLDALFPKGVTLLLNLTLLNKKSFASLSSPSGEAR